MPIAADSTHLTSASAANTHVAIKRSNSTAIENLAKPALLEREREVGVGGGVGGGAGEIQNPQRKVRRAGGYG